MLTNEDLQNIKGLLKGMFKQQNQMLEQRFNELDSRMDGLDSRMDELDSRMDGLDSRMDGLEKCFYGMEGHIEGLETYMHRKFAMIENEVIPKINALYETTDLYVRRIECRKKNNDIEERLDYIEPLVVITQSHSEKLARHEMILKKLVGTV